MAVVGGTVAIIGFVTLSGGSLIAIQGFASLGNIGVEAFTGFFAALANTRVAAPIVSGVALAATVGAGATAQLGAMRISEEIDALEVMGIKSISSMVASRAGLVMEAGSKVTYNGVEIGRVGSISEIERDGRPAAKLVLDVNPRYISLIPVNVVADIEAATLFGNKYVALSAPKIPQQQRISSHDVIDVGSVTTEFNTLFETITSIAEKVDPIELNATLSAVAQALDGLGGKFGESIVNGNQILAQLNPRLPQLGYDVRRLADLGEVYVDASPDLWSFLQNALTTARTLTSQQRDLDAALLAATGAGNTGEDVFARGGPYLARAAADLVPTATLLDTYSPELFCMIRNFHDAAPKVADAVGGNGYSLAAAGTILGAPNPYVYPDNLPRVNAHGGPGGRPGCWQTITRELWPAPYLVMDTGASLAPYNHVELGQPMFTEYVWGRQYGENTINP
ncbi:MCE family protein [Mycobacterium tuberculosis]